MIASRWNRYAVAVALMAASVVASYFLERNGTDTYALMVAAAAISCWYGGALPSVLASIAGWTAAWFFVTTPQWSWAMPTRTEFIRWLVPLVASLVVIWVSWALRRIGMRAVEHASSADRARFQTEAVQELTRELSSALTPSDVAHTLVSRVPRLIGSTGAALGLIEGEALRIVDPDGAPQQTLAPGVSLPLQTTRAPIVAAARTGQITYVSGRDEFESEFPDDARVTPHASGALAVPLRVAGQVVGAMAFPFDRPDAIDDDIISLASLAAELGGQALERAGLYDEERQSREALDRIARLAPTFDSESTDLVTRRICEEAVRTFGADVAEMWLPDGPRRFAIVGREPQSEQLPIGTSVDEQDYPGLAESLAHLEPLFIPDSLATVKGKALAWAQAFGTRSSFRVPIAVAGRAEHVLVLQWTRRMHEVSPWIVALARRFADQAGLALEYSERREAQLAATQNAEETRRLLDVTAAMAAEMEPPAVAETALREAFRALGATAGVVWRKVGDERLEIVGSLGHAENTLGESDSAGLDAELPIAEAIRRNEIVTIGTRKEQARRYPALSRRETLHESSLNVPLAAAGTIVGGLSLSFSEPRLFSDADRDFALALSRQTGQALDRASLLETEHAARMRAERMASDVAQLHALATALGRAETAGAITAIVIDQLINSAKAHTACVVYRADDGSIMLLDARGIDHFGLLTMASHSGIDDPGPLVDAVLSAEPIWLATAEDWRRYDGGDRWTNTDGLMFGVVPILLGGRATGALAVVLPGSTSDEDRRFVETVARQAAQPLERVRLLDAERASRLRVESANRRLARLQTVTESLAAAPSSLEVTEVMIVGGCEALEADGALLHLYDQQQSKLVLARSTPQADKTALLRLRDGKGPIAAARNEAALVEAFDGEASPYAHTLSIPLAAGFDVFGVLTLGFYEPRSLDEEERRTASILGRQCAQAFERSRLFDEEQVARGRSERLGELTTSLASALTPGEVLDVFVRQAGPAVAAVGVGAVLLDSELGSPLRASWRERGLSLPDRWLEADLGTPVRQAIETAQPVYHEASALVEAHPEVGPYLAATGITAITFVPLLAGRRVLGIAALAWHSVGSDGIRTFVETFAGQCGQALDRALRYETERSIAETLQRSVLPETLPSMEGAAVAARYLPGTAAVDVGGDWFDTIPLADGRLGFIVGDVVGKGVKAASTMAQLRNGMRALTLDSSDVSSVVSKLNRLLESYTDAPFATLAFLTVDPVTHEAELLSAGHLPPLVVRREEPPTFLDGAKGLPLGVDPDATYETRKLMLAAGDVVVLYTDGLIERRDRSLDDGLCLLLDAATDAPDDPERLVDLLLERLVGDSVRGDDIAVLAVAFDRAPLGTFDVQLPADREALIGLRESFGRWLERGAIGETDRRDLVLATWEASANAIEHAQEPSSDFVHVEATLSGDRVRVAVSDSGRWRDPEERPDRGLGLRMMQSLMTSCVVQPSVSGTTVVMERALSRERAGEGGAHAAEHRTT